MSHNGQKHFKNLLQMLQHLCGWPLWDTMHERVKDSEWNHESAGLCQLLKVHSKYRIFMAPRLVPEAVAQRCYLKKGVFKNFAKLTGKHLCQSLFFNKVEGLGLQLY